MMRRDYYFDNLKCALIFLVVAGHFLLPLEQTRFIKTIFFLIYLFHMPCFVLVSGYFAKGIYRDGIFRVDRLVQIIWLYILFKLSVHVTENLAAGLPVGLYIDFFNESGAPWYLLALVWWYLTIPVIRHFKPGVVLAVSVLFSMAVGYQQSIGYVLTMSRTMVFAPFFYLGYYLTKEHIRAFRTGKWRWAALAAACAVVLLMLAGSVTFLSPYLSISYGMNYTILPESVRSYGAIIRLVWYLAALALSLGLILVTPEKKTICSFIGKNSLQIYILHRLLRDMMQYWGFYNHVNVHSKVQVMAVILLAAVATVVLGNRYLAVVFDWIRCMPDRLIAWCKK